jgi:hypothetical protein
MNASSRWGRKRPRTPGSSGAPPLVLAAALSLASLAAACGPQGPHPPDVPHNPPATAPGDIPPTVTAPPTTATAQATAPVAPAVTGPGNNTPLRASQMLGDLKAAGVNLAAYPDLDKMPVDLKKKVMPFFKKALGYESCTGCHVEGDFKQETRNMKVARGMWKHFVSELRDEKGGPIFCDSCHAGKAHVLDRADRTVLKKFMETDYEGKLTRADKKDQECGSCHGDGMEFHILEKLWGIPAK